MERLPIVLRPSAIAIFTLSSDRDDQHPPEARAVYPRSVHLRPPTQWKRPPHCIFRQGVPFHRPRGDAPLLLWYKGMARTRCHSSVLTSIVCLTNLGRLPFTPSRASPSSCSNRRRLASFDLLRNWAATVAILSTSSSWLSREATIWWTSRFV